MTGVWQWKKDDGTYSAFSALNCQYLDMAQSRGQPSIELEVPGGGSVTVVFAEMVQRRGRGSKARQVRRCSRPTWLWSHNGSFRPYDDSTGQYLETALEEGQTWARVTLSGQEYDIDFESMTQVCVGDASKVRQVRRTALEGTQYVPTPARSPASAAFSVPPYWTRTDPGLQPLPSSQLAAFQALLTSTYRNIKTLDSGKRGAGVPVPTGFQVVSVQRNENPQQFLRYRAACDLIADELDGVPPPPVPVAIGRVGPEQQPLDLTCGEVFLLHGTPAWRQVLETGLSMEYCREPAMLGRKIYHAENSTKADEFAGTGAGGPLVMLCNRVALGRCFDAGRSVPAIPDVDAKLCNGFHSVMATRQFREFAVADSAQTYVEYVITYTRV